MRINDADTDQRVLVIAEVGNNHEGDESVAERLVREAAAAGADAVKFQTFRTEHYVSASDADRFARLKSFELGFDAFERLATLARSLGLAFISTPFDLESATFLGEVADAVKIASGDNAFFPLIDAVAATGKPMLVSTGGSDLARTSAAVDTVRQRWDGADHGLAVLHCVSSYPTPPDEANVAAVATIADAFPGVTPGYSDHTTGVDAAVLAVAVGARVIEKHFTLDHAFSDFRDHLLSAEPAELSELVERIRSTETLLGSGEKEIQPSEAASLDAIRRSIVASRDLPAGHVLALADLTWIRPAGGLDPGNEDQLIGKTLNRPVAFGERLLPNDLG